MTSKPQIYLNKSISNLIKIPRHISVTKSAENRFQQHNKTAKAQINHINRSSCQNEWLFIIITIKAIIIISQDICSNKFIVYRI